MPSEADLLRAIERDPADDVAWLALADCLEENGEDGRAELVRLREWLRHAELDDPQRPEKERRQAELLIAGIRPSVPTRTLPLAGKTTLTLALIPPGRFWMGCDSHEPGWESDDLSRRLVTLTSPFWFGVTSVPNGQWRAVLEPQSATGPRPSHPAQSVLWADCGRFCKALAKLAEGEYRLPTEAEWEYACRAGTSAAVYLGDGEINRAAWHVDNSNGHVHAAGKKKPNAWGLCDVLGNVWDWTSTADQPGPEINPSESLAGNVRRRIVKGGAWRSSVGRCRAATRYAEQTVRQTDDQGFRVVMAWA